MDGGVSGWPVCTAAACWRCKTNRQIPSTPASPSIPETTSTAIRPANDCDKAERYVSPATTSGTVYGVKPNRTATACGPSVGSGAARGAGGEAPSATVLGAAAAIDGAVGAPVDRALSTATAARCNHSGDCRPAAQVPRRRRDDRLWCRTSDRRRRFVSGLGTFIYRRRRNRLLLWAWQCNGRLRLRSLVYPPIGRGDHHEAVALGALQDLPYGFPFPHGNLRPARRA